VNLLIGAVTIGLILAPLALGVLITFRLFRTLDLTADGSFGLGAAVVAALLVRGVPPLPATIIGAATGVGAGAITAVLQTRFQVSPLLAGVLTSTALYSVSLFVMGGGNLSVSSADSIFNQAERLGQRLLGLPPSLTIGGTSVSGASLASLVVMSLLAIALAVGLAAFLRTDLGVALRAAGNNPEMARASGINVEAMVLLALGLSNGLIALAGVTFAQFQGFASIQMGMGTAVMGVATLMIGEVLTGRRTVGRWIAGAVGGAVIFRLVVAAAIRAGLNPNALKLATAVIVLAVLIVPVIIRRARAWRPLPGASSRA